MTSCHRCTDVTSFEQDPAHCELCSFGCPALQERLQDTVTIQPDNKADTADLLQTGINPAI